MVTFAASLVSLTLTGLVSATNSWGAMLSMTKELCLWLPTKSLSIAMSFNWARVSFPVIFTFEGTFAIA